MTELHIGTMGWSYSFWVGNFYPKELKATEFLTEYSKYFDTVEVDSTFLWSTLREYGFAMEGSNVFEFFVLIEVS